MSSSIICPSMLSCDFAQLASEGKRMIDCGADWLHMDVMDGHFVPNITIGPIVIKSLRKNMKNVFLDCHLMVSHPLKWIEPFGSAGANQISYHFETQSTLEDHQTIIQAIKAQNMRVSMAIKPGTPLIFENGENENKDDCPSPLEVIQAFESDFNQILIMTVEPGFGGQKFMAETMSKVQHLRKTFPLMNIQVDGGVNVNTIEIAASAGANVIVSGSGVFKYPCVEEPDCKKAISLLRKAVDDGIIANKKNIPINPV